MPPTIFLLQKMLLCLKKDDFPQRLRQIAGCNDIWETNNLAFPRHLTTTNATFPRCHDTVSAFPARPRCSTATTHDSLRPTPTVQALDTLPHTRTRPQSSHAIPTPFSMLAMLRTVLWGMWQMPMPERTRIPARPKTWSNSWRTSRKTAQASMTCFPTA